MKRGLSSFVKNTALAALALLAGTTAAFAETDYDVKAAFTVRFADYVQWPRTGGPVVIGIVGRDPFGGAFQRLLAENPDAAKRVRVRNIAASDVAAMRECNIVFVSNSESDRVASILKALSGQPVLTVSDIDGFEDQGGAIGFTIRSSKVKFKVNESAAVAQGLKLDKALIMRSAR